MSSLPWNNVSQMSMSFYFSNDQTNIQLSSYWRYKYMPLFLIGYFESKAPEKLQMQKEILTSLLFMEEGNFIYIYLPLWQEEKKIYLTPEKRSQAQQKSVKENISQLIFTFPQLSSLAKATFFLNVFTTCYSSSNLVWQCLSLTICFHLLSCTY